jgi:protein gp37
MANRLSAMRQTRYANGFTPTLQPDVLEIPFSWKKPRSIFVNSMSDLFHKSVPLEYIQDVFRVMSTAHWHIFQILTKRAERLERLATELSWPSNVWIGVTVESAEYLSRIDHLLNVPAKIRFVSFEPLLGPISTIPLSGIEWVIVGGESGPKARPMNKEWVRIIRDMCVERHVPFFFKQWGGVKKKRNGRELDGRTWDELPGY